jgi:hypothetical protein
LRRLLSIAELLVKLPLMVSTGVEMKAGALVLVVERSSSAVEVGGRENGAQCVGKCTW